MAIKSSTPLLYVQQSLTTVANLTTPPAAATYALLIPESQAIRWRDDGTDPTAAIGMPISAGQSFVYDGDVTKIRVVSQTGTASLNIAYYVARRGL